MSISLAYPTEIRAEPVEQIASALLQSRVVSVEPIAGGRNSRVYRVRGADKHLYALKIYYRHRADIRNRWATEFSSLEFLWANGVRQIPQPLIADCERGCALYEFVEGQQIAASEVTSREIEAAVAFVAQLRRVKDGAGSRALPAASEACFSGVALQENLQKRLQRLVDHHAGASGDPTLGIFLAEQFIPVFELISRWSFARYPYQTELDWSERTLSPSDFGFHNALKRADGQIVFLDLEYFGWDDPAKLLSDFLLHPAMEVGDALKRQFAAALLQQFADCAGFAQRAPSVYPLYGLKWCLILLNEFLPEHLSRRRFADSDAAKPAVQRAQLSKAQRMLERIYGEYEHFAYFD